MNDFMSTQKFQQVFSLIICFVMMMAVSIRKDEKLLGHSLRSDMQKTAHGPDTLQVLSDGTRLVHTRFLAHDVTGYAGEVPLNVFIRDGKVLKIEAEKNDETPDFFASASTLLSAWNGKTIEEAIHLKVDAVSGATYSSRAIITNVRRGLHWASSRTPDAPSLWSGFGLSLKNFLGLVVVLMAAILPLWVKNKRYRLVQQCLNVVVLGFYCGAFLSYTVIVSSMSHGMDVLTLLVPIVMLLTAFIYPLFGKKSYYCTHVCPFGALQDLTGRCVKTKWRLPVGVLKGLDIFRQVLWSVLMFLLWSGLWFDWINYEPFSAFIFDTASWVVLVIAGLFVLLSTVVQRPYCRFVCPTGTLFKLSQSKL